MIDNTLRGGWEIEGPDEKSPYFVRRVECNSECEAIVFTNKIVDSAVGSAVGQFDFGDLPCSGICGSEYLYDLLLCYLGFECVVGVVMNDAEGLLVIIGCKCLANSR